MEPCFKQVESDRVVAEVIREIGADWVTHQEIREAVRRGRSAVLRGAVGRCRDSGAFFPLNFVQWFSARYPGSAYIKEFERRGRPDRGGYSYRIRRKRRTGAAAAGAV